jgi:Carboxypeptidase regulatory-like domain/TonB-dependent Receptor Plug Domain
MIRFWRIFQIKSLLPLLFCIGLRSLAQFSAATVAGVVQDSSKATITDASLKLINTQTGTENDSITSPEGGFLLAGIIPGTYTLQIERDGFATTHVNGITLNGGDIKRMLIQMKVGPVTETVNVDASGLVLNRTDASVSTVIDRKLISTVPLNGRSLQDLISLTPGVITQSPQEATLTGSQTQGDFSVNGQQTDTNSYFVDGVAAIAQSGPTSDNSRIGTDTSFASLTALGTTQSLVPADALQEFRILSSTYSAEFGRTPGGQFTFVTRSGASQIHGSLYDYFRSNLMDAQDWFSTDGPRYSYNPAYYNQDNFGATFGAPLSFPKIYNGRDKTFVFLSYEGLYVDQQTPQTYQFVPQVCGPTGEGGVLAFLCNTAPAIPSPIAAMLTAFPFAEPAYSPTDQTALFQLPADGAAFPSHLNAASVRVDHTFSPRLSMFWRYGNTASDGTTNEISSVTARRATAQSLTFGTTYQFTPTRSNDLRAGYARVNNSARTFTAFVGTEGGGVSGIEPVGDLRAALGVPGADDSTSADAYIHLVGTGDSDSNVNQLSNDIHQWNIRDTFSLQHSNHLLKFGIDQQRVELNVTPPTLSVLADFFTPTSLQNNAASDLVITKSLPGHPVLNEFSAFAEDEFKISPTLNLSLGLRWDVNPAPTGRNGQNAYTVLGDVSQPSTLQLGPRGTPLWHTSWHNLGPRFGVAWSARNEPGREVVVRAGAGVFFDTGTQPALRAFSGLGFSTYASFLNAPIPVTAAQLNVPTLVAPPYTHSTTFAFDPHLQLPYSWQWNLSVEQALGSNQSVTFSYVGANGRRLLQEERRDVSQLNPEFGDVSYFPSGLISNFDSLQVKFQRSFSRGIEALASYTWAHALDFGSTDPAFPLKYGDSDLDVRQNFEAAASWSSSPAKHRFFSKRRLLEGWGADAQFVARSSFPVDLLGNFLFDPVTGRPYYSGVDLIPGRPLYLPGSQYPGRRIFNGGANATNPAFSLPGLTEQGDAPRNLVRGFGEVQGNLAVRQNYHLRDEWNMQLKVETFNVFNHPNFGYIDPSFSDLYFGQATKMLNQSFGAAGSHYNEGGPRGIQLSLRLTF